jgi:hypothetical protein
MEKPEKIIQKLNEVVDSDPFDLTEFDSLIIQFKELLKTDVKFLDLEFYDEARMITARSNKTAKEELNDFNAAFEYREIERKCLKYSQLKSEFNIEKSSFYQYKDYLLYFCLGTGKNDKVVRDYMNDLDRLKKV